MEEYLCPGFHIAIIQWWSYAAVGSWLVLLYGEYFISLGESVATKFQLRNIGIYKELRTSKSIETSILFNSLGYEGPERVEVPWLYGMLEELLSG